MYYSIKIDKSKIDDIDYLKKQCELAYDVTHDPNNHDTQLKDFTIQFMVSNTQNIKYDIAEEFFITFKSHLFDINLRYIVT